MDPEKGELPVCPRSSADLLLIGAAAATVLYAQNSKHIKEVMDGLAAQLRMHLAKMANNSQSPDPQGGWQREIRAALERMQRLGKRLGDKTMQQYKDIMAQASQVLK